MRLRRFSIVILGLALLGGGAWTAHRFQEQREEVRSLRQRLEAIEQSEPKPVESSASGPPGAPKSPSPELLKARATVAALRVAAGGSAVRADGTDSAAGSDDLNRLMKGRLPSSQPDFVAAAAVRNRGFGTAEDALETFWWHFAAPGRANQESFGQLWWSPEGEAPEGYHYEIGLGMGVGAFTGYRVARRDNVSDDEVVFHLEREERGSVVEEEARMIRVGDHWVRKPAVRLVKNGP